MDRLDNCLDRTVREELDKINAFGYHLTDLYPKENRADAYHIITNRPGVISLR